MTDIRSARWPDDALVVRELFQEYADGLGVDLAFQDFASELATLPGRYAPPAGQVLIAWRDGDAMACVAMRPLERGRCEMKRLYVRPQARGESLGRRLIERLCRAAREAGHREMVLDTLPTMVPARELYRSLGFEPVEPYTYNPIAGTAFLALDLSRPRP